MEGRVRGRGRKEGGRRRVWLLGSAGMTTELV